MLFGHLHQSHKSQLTGNQTKTLHLQSHESHRFSSSARVINQTTDKSNLEEENKTKQKTTFLDLVKKAGPGPRQSAQAQDNRRKKRSCPGGASHGPTTPGSSSRGLLLLSAAAANEAASTDSCGLLAPVEPELVGGGGLLAASLLGVVAADLSLSIVL
jgi:hypothetical protein